MKFLKSYLVKHPIKHGGRKNHRNKFNILIASKYVDVLSFNQYVNELNDFNFPRIEG